MATPSRQTVGPWTLNERLGAGGNAVVWSATKAGEDHPLAVKVINTTKVDREPYQRFVREIAFLREHQDVPGLLPLVDAYLPDEPSRSDRPWLAMPIARPITDALEDGSLADVVGALAAISRTLLGLQQDFNIAHRDIKPGNLYELDGQWLIGDFGLVAIPDAESLTREGKQVGPAHFTAYEMVMDAAHADPHPADVYSLGKTLWVLTTGQKFPPDGHQPVGSRRFAIGDFRPHAHAHILDQEVDSMTRLHPEQRPSKEQVARDLESWLELASSPVAFDVADARTRLHSKLASAIAEQDTIENYKEQTYVAIRHLQDLTAPLNDGLKQLYDRAKIDMATDEMTQNRLKTTHPGYPREVVHRWQRCTFVSPFDRPMGIALRMSRSLELMNDGVLVLHLMVHVGPEGVFGTDFHWQLPTAASAPVGTVEAEKMLEDGVRAMADGLKQGVDVFVEKLPELRAGT